LKGAQPRMRLAKASLNLALSGITQVECPAVAAFASKARS